MLLQRYPVSDDEASIGFDTMYPLVLWQFDLAIGNGPIIHDLPTKNVTFYSYAKVLRRYTVVICCSLILFIHWLLLVVVIYIIYKQRPWRTSKKNGGYVAEIFVVSAGCHWAEG